MKVVKGFHRTEGQRCPFCGDDYMSIADDGDEATYLVTCWCGATARVAKTDVPMPAGGGG